MEQYLHALRFMKLLSQIFGFLLQIAPEAIGAFIAVSGSLWLFKKQTSRENHAKNQNLKILISSAISDAGFQVENLMNLVKTNSEYPSRVPELEFATKTNLIRLNRLFDDPSTLVAFMELFGNDDTTVLSYRKISDCADFILLKCQEAHDAFGRWKKADSDLREKYISDFENLWGVCNKAHQELSGGHDNFASIVLEHIERFNLTFTEGTDDVGVPQEGFVSPLKTTLNLPLPEYSRKVEMKKICMELTLLYIKIVDQNKFYQSQFDKDILDIKTAIDAFNKNNQFIKN